MAPASDESPVARVASQAGVRGQLSLSAMGWVAQLAAQPGWRELGGGQALLSPSALLAGFTGRHGSAGSWSGSAFPAPSRRHPLSRSVGAPMLMGLGQVMWAQQNRSPTGGGTVVARDEGWAGKGWSKPRSLAPALCGCLQVGPEQTW